MIEKCKEILREGMPYDGEEQLWEFNSDKEALFGYDCGPEEAFENRAFDKWRDDVFRAVQKLSDEYEFVMREA
jgi:hypothetical protein